MPAKPDWNLAFSSDHKDSKTVEAPLTVQGEFGFASKESYQAFKETGDKKYILSRTSIVIEKKRNKTIGFLMTIVPDKKYQESNDFNAFSSSYRKWQKGFSGLVLYHNLDGSFSNGWRLLEGKVVNTVKHIGEEGTNIQLSSKGYLGWYWVHWELNYYVENKGTKGWVYTEQWTYLYTTCDGEGSNGGTTGTGGNGGIEAVYAPGSQSGTANVDKIYDPSSTLLYNQKIKLEEALIEYKRRNPFNAYILNYLYSRGEYVKFKIDPTITGPYPACYIPNASTIVFRDEDCITANIFQEELIHRYQNDYYGSLFDNSKRNFEFEAKVIEDVNATKYTGGPYFGLGGFQTETDKANYARWILQISLDDTYNIYEFNNYCQIWSYPQPPNNWCDFNFVPEVLNFNLSNDYEDRSGQLPY